MTTELDPQNPQPGIYTGVSFEDYLAINAVNNSALSELAKSPRHYRCFDGLEPKPHLVVGVVAHCGALEPMEIPRRYAVQPDYKNDPGNVTKSGERSRHRTDWVTEQEELFAAANAGKQIVKQDWYDAAAGIVAALHSEPEACLHLNTPGRTELTLVWSDPATDILCKARLDKEATELRRIVDLKSTRDLFRFQAAISNLGYYRQLAHYQDGYRVLTGNEFEPWLIAVESSKPFCCQAAPVSDDAIHEGNRERAELLRLLKRCRESNRWPGPESPACWELPAWRMSDEIIAEEIEV